MLTEQLTKTVRSRVRILAVLYLNELLPKGKIIITARTTGEAIKIIKIKYGDNQLTNKGIFPISMSLGIPPPPPPSNLCNRITPI